MDATKPPLVSWIAFLSACVLSAICLTAALGCFITFVFDAHHPIYILGSILFGWLYKKFERGAFSFLSQG